MTSGPECSSGTTAAFRGVTDNATVQDTMISGAATQQGEPVHELSSTRVVKCSLDEDQCLSLCDILSSFQTAINEEQAWAICYQALKCFRQHYQPSHCYLISEPDHVHIHKDGHVHPKTLYPSKIINNEPDKGHGRTVARNSHKLLTSLGIVLFRALDYGLCDDEERTLSKPLELLIERLTTAHDLARRQRRTSGARVAGEQMHSIGSLGDDESVDGEDDEDEEEDECANADEGIERDCHEFAETQQASLGGAPLVCFDHLIQMCVSRLSSHESADGHYRAVCRALIAETLELSIFLDQIAKGTKEIRRTSLVSTESHQYHESSESLEKLEFHDWARLWIQVIRELRHGVKLKKVDQDDSIHHAEYELTPYEMLLDDIRSRRYKLNKVMINGGLPPRVKKDAHELILEFIRSRPPLVPVSQRVLRPPPPKHVTLYERLMESIRQEHKLRPTPKPTKKYSFSAHTTPRHRPDLSQEEPVNQATVNRDSSTKSILNSVPSRRKLIKANIELNLNLDDDEDSGDEMLNQQLVARTVSSVRTARPMSAYFPSEMFEQNFMIEEHVASESEQEKCEKSVQQEPVSTEAILRLKQLSHRLFSRERRHSISGFDLKSLQRHQSTTDMIEDLDFNEDARNHVATIWENSDLGKSLECLSLTLKEVQHIRSVLTKAEIESLGVTKSLKKDLENGKICFTCLKTRFTFWGPWATICKLCNRAICDRCSTKMHIPKEQFERVPIYMLSPTNSPPGEKRITDLFHRSSKSESTRTVDTSESENEAESKSLPPKISNSRNRMARIVRMLTSHEDDSDQSASTGESTQAHSGPLVKVCRDCKILVRHLIDIGHTNFGGSQYSTNQ